MGLRITKEQKDKLAAGKGSAVAACRRYEAIFRVAEPGPKGAPVQGVRYTIRSSGKRTWSGTTDEEGLTEKVETKGPELLSLEITQTIVTVDHKGDEKGRREEKIKIAEGVSACAPVDPAAPTATGRIGDRLDIVLHPSSTPALRLTRLTIVHVAVRYASGFQPATPGAAPDKIAGVMLDTRPIDEKGTAVFPRDVFFAITELSLSTDPRRGFEILLAPDRERPLLAPTLTLPVKAKQHCAKTGACVLEYHVEIHDLPMLYFAIHYANAVKDKPRSFQLAAETWQDETEGASPFRKGKDIMMILPMTTKADFLAAWATIASVNAGARVVDARILSHGSDQSLEFAETSPGAKDGTLKDSEVTALAPLRWGHDAKLVLAGCDTSESGVRYPIAWNFAVSQRVFVTGQRGKGYFSKEKRFYEEIDDAHPSKPIYLWSYRHGARYDITHPGEILDPATVMTGSSFDATGAPAQ